MADERKIVIVLKSEDIASSNSVGEENKEPENLPKQASDKKAIAAFAAKEMTSAVVSEVLNWANYEWDKSLNLNDDYIGQRQKTIALQLINKGASFASTIFSATAYGAMIGQGAGAVVGAVLGTVQATSSVIRENIQAREQEEIQLRQMEAQLSYTRQRAGWSTQAGSIGEDL